MSTVTTPAAGSPTGETGRPPRSRARRPTSGAVGSSRCSASCSAETAASSHVTVAGEYPVSDDAQARDRGSCWA
ncbi:hypothetical protein BJF88_11790 [Cellulosimicrobium sp. CUA-896]|nr:hypothetical protein BJF88_11790 [Cellulosimicrobium sp. CUA-896]